MKNNLLASNPNISIANDQADKMEFYERTYADGSKQRFTIEEYEKMKSNLLAPNGKPSNLTAEQYKLVRTPEFKAWFGDWENDPSNASKVLDDNGEPLVVYHGTNSDFYKFTKTKGRGKKNQSGIYLTDNPSVAKLYGDRILMCFASIKNPFTKDYQGSNYHELYGSSDLEVTAQFYRSKKKISNVDGVIFYNIKDALNRFDVAELGNNYIPFNSNQIKLADGTNTTFDADNPDIRYDDGGVSDEYTNQKIKKAYVSIRINDEVERTSSWGYDYIVKSIDPKPFEELSNGVLDGVLGISTSSYNLSEWLVQRDCLVVMPFNEFLNLNDAEQVKYFDADYLTKNGLEPFFRLYNRKQNDDDSYYSVLQNIFPKISNEFVLEATSGVNGSLYSLMGEIFNPYNSSKFIKYVGEQPRIQSPEMFAQIVCDYINSGKVRDDYRYVEFENVQPDDIIKPLIKGIVSSGEIYRDESEWLLKDKKLVVPKGSQLFFVVPTYPNFKEENEKMIDAYGLRDLYKIGYVKQSDLNRFQQQRWKLKEDNFKKELNEFKGSVDKKISNALVDIENEILNEFERNLFREIDEDEYLHPEYFKDYDGNKYSTFMEIPEVANIYNDFLYKLSQVIEQAIPEVVKNKSKYYLSQVDNTILQYINLLDEENRNREFEFMDEYGTKWNYYDLIYKIKRAFKQIDFYKYADSIKNRVGGDLYRAFSKDEIMFKNGGKMKSNLLAPNGKPSNLTAEQYKLVRTQAFKDWFGDWENDPENASEVVDENGEPLVVYRGWSSNRSFGYVFNYNTNLFGSSDRSTSRKKNRFGFYFTPSKPIAEVYAEDFATSYNDDLDYRGLDKTKATPIVQSYFLNIRRILNLTETNPSFPSVKKLSDNYNDLIKKMYGSGLNKKRYKENFDRTSALYGTELGLKDLSDMVGLRKKDFDGNQYLMDKYENNDIKVIYSWFINDDTQSDTIIREKIISKGYNGVFFKETTGLYQTLSSKEQKKYYQNFDKGIQIEYPFVFVAFEPNQIKLADGSNTTFMSNKPDIRFKKGGSVKESKKIFGDYAFTDKYNPINNVSRSIQGTNSYEDDNALEEKIFNLIHKWTKGSPNSQDIFKQKSVLEQAKNQYPKIFSPNYKGLIYRGLSAGLDEIDFPKNVELSDFEKIRTLRHEDYFLYKKPIQYKPKKNVESWTTDIDVAAGFGGNVVFVSKLDDSFYMNPDVMNAIYDEVDEDETIKIGQEFTKNVFVMVRDLEDVAEYVKNHSVIKLDSLKFTKRFNDGGEMDSFPAFFKSVKIEDGSKYIGLKFKDVFPFLYKKRTPNDFKLFVKRYYQTLDRILQDNYATQSMKQTDLNSIDWMKVDFDKKEYLSRFFLDSSGTIIDFRKGKEIYSDGGETNDYLKITKQVDNSIIEGSMDGIWISADFGENGGITWEIPRSQIEGGNKNNPEIVVVQSIDRDKNKDVSKEGSKGEGTKAIASLFHKYPALKEILYDDESEGFWEKIGGNYDQLKREDFFKYYNKKKKFELGGEMKKVDKGGITYGKSHDEGGIPVKNASTGQMLEVEGGEGIVNKRSMASDKMVKLNGKQMSICEAVSHLNQMEGGVKFSCDDVAHRQFIEEMELGGELERGIRTEKEHIETLRKLYENRITPNEAIKEVAKEHIAENPHYYSELSKMEIKDSPSMDFGKAQEIQNVLDTYYLLDRRYDPIEKPDFEQDDLTRFSNGGKVKPSCGCQHSVKRYMDGGIFGGGLEELESFGEPKKEDKMAELCLMVIDKARKLLNQNLKSKLMSSNLNSSLQKYFMPFDKINLYDDGWRFSYGQSKQWAGLCAAHGLEQNRGQKTLYLSVDFVKHDEVFSKYFEEVVYHEMAHALVQEYIVSKIGFMAMKEIDPMHFVNTSEQPIGHGQIWANVCKVLDANCDMFYRKAKYKESFKEFKYECSNCGQKRYGNNMRFAEICFKCFKAVIVTKNDE